ncbi:MAG: flagellar basal-body MS-ring/collar protein FliF [Desulfobacteraceae bacterium]|jgi:flagellar M-ring protein FliF
MDKSFSDIANQLKSIFKTMSAGKLISLMLLTGATVWGVIALVQWSGKPDFMPLYSHLSAEDAGEVVGRLREQKIPFQLSHNGGTVLIPKSRIYEMRLEMAAQGLPRGSSVGFEVFDNTKLGMTEFVQNINYQRALQGELSRTINGLAEVESSRVHVVMSPRSLFIEQEEPATASVILKLNHGRYLSNSQIQGIVHLVSSSVPRLLPEHVTIVDQNGKLLAGQEDEMSATKLSMDHLEFQQRKERLLEKRVLTMLEQVVGKGNAIVRVACTLDFMQQELTEEKYYPDNQVVRSEQLSQELSSKADAGPMGVPGMASNINPSGASEAQTSSPASFKRQDNTRNYEIGKRVSRQIMPVGNLENLSVAVIVDGKYETVTVGKGDKQKTKTNYLPRSNEEMQQLENIVKRAVNFDEARGDKVELENIAFNADPVETMPEAAGAGKILQLVKPFMSYLKYIAAAIFVLFTFMFVVKPLMRWLTDTSWEDVDLLEHLPKTIAEIEQQYRGQDAQNAPLINQAAQHIANNQADTTMLMQKWLKET